MAESILELAKRLVRLDQQIAQLNRERTEALADYQKLIAGLRNGHNLPETATTQPDHPDPSKNTMRELVLTYLRQHAGVRLSLHEIERAIGADGERRRLTWTLANMKRDGVIRHEGRGLWSVGREDEDPEAYKPPQGNEDLPF